MTQTQWSLFGLDLSGVAASIRVAFRQLLESPEVGLATRFQAPVRLYDENGEFQVCSQWGAVPKSSEVADVELTAAAVVPESLLLARSIALPASVEGDLGSAVEFEVLANSPFPIEDVCYGVQVESRTPDSLALTIYMAAKADVATWLRKCVPDGVDPSAVEPWVQGSKSEYVVLNGFGGNVRREGYFAALKRQALRWSLVVTGIAVFLASPSMVVSINAAQLQDELDRVRAAAGDASSARSALVEQRDVVGELLGLLDERVDHGYWVHQIALLSPDSVHLTRVQFEGREVEIQGLASNAAQYLSALAESQEFESVQASGTFTRDRNSGNERFVIDLTLPRPPAI